MAMLQMPVRHQPAARAVAGLRGLQPRFGMRRGVGRPRGMGSNEVADQLQDEGVDSTYSYYTSPAFLASQAAAVAASDAASCVDPTSPGCVGATAVDALTHDSTLGYNPIADTTLNLTNYCQQNVQNAAIFNTALDTTNCSGSSPTAAVLAQVNAIGAKSTITPATEAQVASILANTPYTPYTAYVPPTPISSPIVVAANNSTSNVPAITNSPSNSSTSLISSPGDATTDAAITWVEENWIYLAAGLAALVILPAVMKS